MRKIFEGVEFELLRLLTDRLSGRLIQGSGPELLGQCVSDLMRSLIEVSDIERGSPFVFTENSELSARLAKSEFAGMDIQLIARCYERLNGLSLSCENSDKPVLKVTRSTRHSMGQFYTPAKVAREIVRRSLDALEQESGADFSDISILDPAVGGGVFLTEAIEEIRQRSESNPLKWTPVEAILPKALHGTDIDPVATLITKAAIGRKLGFRGSASDVSLPHIRVGNSLIGADRLAFESSQSVQEDSRLIGDSRHGCSAHQPPSSSPLKYRLFDWPDEFPHVFQRNNPGFDLIIGNPPYEVLSGNLTGRARLREEINYYRANYQSCHRKINTYRLMMERAVNLLRNGGVLGFLVPSTILADSSASILRLKLLTECELLELITIPENARLFDGVTQAFSILIARRGRSSRRIRPMLWRGLEGEVPEKGAEIDVDILDENGLRIPILRSEAEGRLLTLLSSHPTLSSRFGDIPPVRAHQGEINMTNQRMWLSEINTGIRLVRGEHVAQFEIKHPSICPGRWDWLREEIKIDPKFSVNQKIRNIKQLNENQKPGGRIVVARVVNMDSPTRLKAAWVNRETFLGDMTNYLDRVIISPDFTLGLLNSSLLNWRFRITSGNNYVSAAELEALPIPFQKLERPFSSRIHAAPELLHMLISLTPSDLRQAVLHIDTCIENLESEDCKVGTICKGIELIVSTIRKHLAQRVIEQESLRAYTLILDALVISLYSAEDFIGLFDPPASSRLKKRAG